MRRLLPFAVACALPLILTACPSTNDATGPEAERQVKEILFATRVDTLAVGEQIRLEPYAVDANESKLVNVAPTCESRTPALATLQTTKDANGTRVLVTGASPGIATVQCKTENGVSASRKFVVVASGRLQLRVLDVTRDYQPVSGTRVLLYSFRQGVGEEGVEFSGGTGEQATSPAMVPGPWVLDVRKDGYVPTKYAATVVAGQTTVLHPVLLVPASSAMGGLKGTIYDARAAGPTPIAGAQVYLVDMMYVDPHPPTSETPTTTTDASGKFQFAATLKPGAYSIVVRAPGRDPFVGVAAVVGGKTGEADYRIP